MDENWAKKLGSMKDYDNLAAGYDAQYEGEQIEKFEVTLRSLSLNSHDVVLDVGCGTGLLMGRVAKTVRLVVGVDFSKAMVMRARERLRLFLNVLLIRADSDFLPLREDVFTHVFAVTLLQNMPKPWVTLRELMRVTWDEGFIVFTGLKKNFTLSDFKTLVKRSGLRQLSLVDRGEVKDYVAVCQRLRK